MVKPSEIGERAEAAVLAALTTAGRRVLIPFGPQRFDFAYEDQGRLVKVQCKTGVVQKGVIKFLTCSVSRHGERRDYREDVDLFGVYCHERREVYLVPWPMFPDGSPICESIRPETDKRPESGWRPPIF